MRVTLRETEGSAFHIPMLFFFPVLLFLVMTVQHPLLISLLSVFSFGGG